MKLRCLFAIALFAVAVLALVPSALAQVSPDYQLTNTIPIPSNLTSFDISWVDQGSQRYYLADRGNGKG